MAKKVKILMICGLGLESSFACQMTAESVLKENGVDADLDHADISSATSIKADVIVTAENFRTQFQKFTLPETTSIVYLKSLVSKKEIQDKLIPVLKEKGFI